MDQHMVGQPIYHRDGSKAGTIKEVTGPYVKVNVSMRPDYWLHRDDLMPGQDGTLVVQDGAVHYDAPAINRDTDSHQRDRDTTTGNGRLHASDGESTRRTLLLHEERARNLTAVPEQVAAARITTHVVEVAQTITVPLREERVLIERVVGGGEVIVDGRALTEGETVEIVLRREQPRITKDVVEVERIDVRTELVEQTRPVSILLKREELTADYRGDVETLPDATTRDAATRT
jgi:uncharacterized protein (TIGR02271 family)